MAKKKPTSQNKSLQTQEESTHQVPTMDEASEKLQHLKSLNSRLINEAAERRKLVGSLQHSNGSLQSALTRSEMENKALQEELTRLNDRTEELEMERQLGFVFIAVQASEHAEVVEKERDEFLREKSETQREMGMILREKCEVEKVGREKGREIEFLKVVIEKERDGSIRVARERDDLRAELDVQVEDTNGLRLKFIEAEKRERKIEEEVHALKMEITVVMEEKEERERRIESMMKEKDSIERSLEESNRVIEGLKRENMEVAREKKRVEEERNMEVVKKEELETSLTALNEMNLALQSEKQRLRAKMEDLEKTIIEFVDKEKDLMREIDELVEENKERERSFEGLIEEKGLVKKQLDDALKKLDEQKRNMDDIVQNKIEIEELTVKKDSVIAALEASFRDQSVRSVELKSEVTQCRCDLNRATVERDEVSKGFEEEKKNVMNLKEKILKLEKKIQETQKVGDEIKAENRSVLFEKKEIESRCTILMEERASLENYLLEARKKLDENQAKLEFSFANSELVLKMLQNAAATMVFISKDEGGEGEEANGLFNKQVVGESVEPFVAELEGIIKCFKERELKIEDMKRQMEFLKRSVAEARKGKSFWTLVSSAAATTIVAAASVAYVARGR